MQISRTEIDKAFSDALVKLFSEGYMLTPTYENGIPKNRMLMGYKIELTKDNQEYEFFIDCDSYTVGENQGAKKYTVSLTEKLRSENLLTEPYVYYGYDFGDYKNHFIFSTRDEVLEIAKKKEERRLYNEWEIKGYINSFKLDTTPYKGFKKNVTVYVTHNDYIFVNKNGRMGKVSKKWGRNCYELVKE